MKNWVNSVEEPNSCAASTSPEDVDLFTDLITDESIQNGRRILVFIRISFKYMNFGVLSF